MKKRLVNPFSKYGVRRVINAATSLTTLGGSIPPEEMFPAMMEAGKCFVRIPELQAWAGEVIARATGAEAGLPTAGAVSGLMLAVAACMMKGTELEKYDPLETERRWGHLASLLPLHTNDLKNEFIVQKSNRNVYDYSIELAGGRIVEVGTENGTTVEELNSAFNQEKTAAYYFTARSIGKCLSLEKVVEVAHENDAPIIVDAAAELPPRRKLRMYIEKGADLVIYSGGKHIAGPNNSGLLAGERDLIKLAHLQSYPFNGVGRAAKMSRETIVGLVTALKLYLEQDEKAAYEVWLRKAQWLKAQLEAIPGVDAGILYQRVVEDGEPMAPFCYLRLDPDVTRISGKELVAELKKGDPCIYTLYEPSFLIREYHERVTINPQYMLEGETDVVVERIRETLRDRVLRHDK